MEQLHLSSFEDPESGMERKIHEVESLNLKPRARAEIILVLLGAKKAAHILFKNTDVPSEEVNQVLTEQCGMYVEKLKRTPLTETVIDEYAVALDPVTAKETSELDPSINHLEFGKMMGYPESAAIAFRDDKKLDKKDYPNMRGIIRFFRLSQENWREELEALKKWSELIKEHAPDLYAEIYNPKK